MLFLPVCTLTLLMVVACDARVSDLEEPDSHTSSNPVAAKPPTQNDRNLPAAASSEQAARPKQPAHPPQEQPAFKLNDPAQETLSGTREAISTPNLHPDPQLDKAELEYRLQLEVARKQRRSRLFEQAKANLSTLLHSNCSEQIKKSALLELAIGAQDENDLPRAQQIFSQYLNRWPHDIGVPEVLLRQGLLYRQMGATKLAISKFYSVLTSSLVLKNDNFDYYQRLVLQAQVEIGETFYLDGKYEDAVGTFKRILKLDNPAVNRAQVQFKLLRSLARLDKHADIIAAGNEFLKDHPGAVDAPEVRFLLANAHKKLGANSESLQQVLLLLKDQQTRTNANPGLLAHWQQRTGNEIANQLYREGDFLRALDIYLALANLDKTAAWQLPVYYQIGLIFERLEQPGKAGEYYARILAREKEVGPEAAPSLKAVLDMAKWRNSFLDWNAKAESQARELKQGTVIEASAEKDTRQN